MMNVFVTMVGGEKCVVFKQRNTPVVDGLHITQELAEDMENAWDKTNVNATMDGGASIVEIQLPQKLVGDYLGTIQKFVMDMEDACVMMFVDVDLDGMAICVNMKDLLTNAVDDTIGIQLFVVDMENVLFLFQEEMKVHTIQDVYVMKAGGEIDAVTKLLQLLVGDFLQLIQKCVVDTEFVWKIMFVIVELLYLKVIQDHIRHTHRQDHRNGQEKTVELW